MLKVFSLMVHCRTLRTADKNKLLVCVQLKVDKNGGDFPHDRSSGQAVPEDLK